MDKDDDMKALIEQLEDINKNMSDLVDAINCISSCVRYSQVGGEIQPIIGIGGIVAIER